ncbi:DUF934 domain-containing protein [Ottowia sp. oral taxon 894]|uniref:DUF934 domain-containing protein n=1 Tax=Ottowia sp. oral taxon 894 TaxID=1658672 RepID=UPI0009E4B3D1|nr:DUF934 domain-containing protein [Ottowia sp. oral taxon 894]
MKETIRIVAPAESEAPAGSAAENPAENTAENASESAASASAAPAPGVLQIANDADVLALAAEGALQGVTCIELNFPKFTDGRAYSQAVLLRRRLGFTGELRATGDVLIDQLLLMQRSGFTSAVLAAGVNAEAAPRQFVVFDEFYQGDAQQPRPHFAREAE